MRQFAVSNKKLRGFKRRLRTLRRWSESFAGYFPHHLTPADRYWNVKISIHADMLHGRKSTWKSKRDCFQQMIDACYRIQQAKPVNNSSRVTCLIALPDMMTSELCIYSSEEYFQSFLREGESVSGKSEIFAHRSLSQEIGLELPNSFHEVGIGLYYPHDNQDEMRLTYERWYFGEVN